MSAAQGMEVSRVARPEKVAIVEELKDKLTQAQAVVLTDYRGLNVQEITELRAAPGSGNRVQGGQEHLNYPCSQ